MRLRTLNLLLTATAVATIAACGGSSGSTGALPVSGGAASASATPSAQQPSGAPATGPAASGAPQATGAPGAVKSSAPGAPGGSKAPASSASPTMPPAPTVAGNHQATEKELPIEASISPACVPAGGLATLTVKTLPKTTLAFVAVYNGEKSGAAPPWGEGYGGNDKGEASADGSWTISWTVTPNAPHGPARVILAAGKNGKQRAINVPFSVGGREAGGCGT